MTNANDVVAATAADLCPECGYDRRGGGAGRACPECGYQQPADESVAWGQTADATVGLWRQTLPVLVVVSAMLVLRAALRSTFGINGSTFVVIGLGWAAGYGWQRTRPRPATAGPQQLRLSPRGFAIRTGCGPVVYKPWKPAWRVEARPRFFGRPEVVVERPLLGPLVLERPLVFRPTPGEVDTVARRIAALLEQVQGHRRDGRASYLLQ